MILPRAFRAKQGGRVGMGIVVGEKFEDYGTAIEYTAGDIRAYERLNGDRVRLYVTEERGEKHVLLYTVVCPRSVFSRFGKVCFEIAEQSVVLPDWAAVPIRRFVS
jgi:hypothetical protein